MTIKTNINRLLAINIESKNFMLHYREHTDETYSDDKVRTFTLYERSNHIASCHRIYFHLDKLQELHELIGKALAMKDDFRGMEQKPIVIDSV